MKWTALVVLAVTVTACSTAQAAPSVLQRFQAMHATFRRVTVDAASVASASGSLSTSLRRSRGRHIVRSAHLLRARSGRLRRDAVLAIHRLARLPAGERDGKVGHYLHLIRTALWHQVREASSLERVCAVLGRDPYERDARDAATVARRYARARAAARGSVFAVRAAAHWKRIHRAAFRYTPA